MHMNAQGIAETLAARFAAISAATAGGTGDATEVDGAYIDRQGFSSLKVIIAYTATLAATKTLTVAANLQDATSTAGAGVADFGAALATAVVATGPTGGGTVTGVVELDFDVSGADRYVRVQYTPDLTATGTDTATLSAVYVLGGAQVQPVTAKAN
ncbi:hypothetical protein DFW101_3505 [Solidesulfovibrio carbinoliphilus subsp. oakridgensis]|uniref:Uncharacterized protein n=1 Tax=Solidesulfovibrio carbinoliphilus subsp. oakridgensis TaxID=694327 RepID=G7QC55_9BACT|nr:hypothetical protein [Solidesulfovibrio carbinoliphilus]EHJ49501.1 hypothetical protein DFW101_3505 [Solidesulfovibrio carbinoliphilus subsp. oakridgensis]